MNILANAIDALDQSCQELTQEVLAQSPRQITITSELLEPSQAKSANKEQSVAIYIKDNGTGMTEEIKNQIFDHLFTTKEVGQGTGLGLSIAHQIVTEKHGGSLRVDSVVGEGSEFVIVLPVKFDR
jgi:signal transduction histidine kinase